MIVLEKPLSGVYPEIDMVTTPTGKPVAMVHCNSCTTDLDAWVRLLGEAAGLFGAAPGKGELYDALYYKALEGDADCGGLLSYNFYAGEPVVAVPEGRPLFVRQPDSAFTLANFLRCHLYGTMAALKLGMNILTEREKVRVERLQGHGGLFKTKGVGQRFMAAALGVPVAVMESAGEGGAWGIALLAAYMAGGRGLSLEAFLEKEVFAGNGGETLQPDRKDAAGFAEYIKRWEKTLAVEKTAGERM
jgi:sugar (pentulose or hexulose) kinase